MKGIEDGRENFDLIIINNDLATGIPDTLKNSRIPIYPSPQAGWHARKKSFHFCITADLMREFAAILQTDPWFFSCLFTAREKIDINSADDRALLKQSAEDLFHRIALKYREHGIGEKPYIVIKADAGTYGMGVLPVEDPGQIMDLNRKDRNKLHKGKGAQVINNFLLQEGVPTIYNVDSQVSETVIYQIENNIIGGFYRTHSGKGSRDNLNAKGMVFHKLYPHRPEYGECGVHHDFNIFDVYRILARIAAIAALKSSNWRPPRDEHDLPHGPGGQP